ncbi:subclass B1 metallo-beta-lactamase [Hyphococcus luteus]|uniref:beta-lactamase n=1 Tax=Hyphococcus luteus TaxID=2058213 RepID=A0A2S7K7F6_9PROT|nr:subclass B1 metallo-beta-lactamase [Marinicaulis flavus]PQA88423.1 subclass B1 metallo-beta-lactamase [Marinicaulis flavus]
MWKVFLAAFLVFIAASARAAEEPAQGETHQAPVLEKIADDVWIHKSWRHVNGWGLVLSQGLVVKVDTGVVLIDTAWTDADTEDLLALIEAETGAMPAKAIVTHAHADKMGGMKALHAHGVETIAHKFSNEDAPARGLTPAQTSMHLLEKGKQLYFAGYSGTPLEVYYPGAGHTRDNIVVYYAPAKVLFGGCLIRPGEASDLGNTADGDVNHWAQAARNVAEAFPEAEIVIPSHGPMGGRELLDHTIDLAESAAAAP